jgi:hypothetical protein
MSLEEYNVLDRIDEHDEIFSPEISDRAKAITELQESLEAKKAKYNANKKIKTEGCKRTINDRIANLKKVNYSKKPHIKVDPLRKEIEDFIKLSISSLGLFPEQASYVVNQSCKKVISEKKEHHIDVIEIYEQVEQLEKEMDVQDHETFSYENFFNKIDAIKDAERIILNTQVTESEMANEDMLALDFRPSFEPDKMQTKSQVFERVSHLVYDLRKNHEDLVHRMNYEDVVLGVILLVDSEIIMENPIREDMLDISGFVKYLYGEKYKSHIINIYKVRDKATRLYVQS